MRIPQQGQTMKVKQLGEKCEHSFADLPPPLFFPFFPIRTITYLSLCEWNDVPEKEEFQKDRRRGPDVPDRQKNGGKLHQGLRVLMKRNPVVTEAVAESAEGDAVRVVGGGVSLQAVHGPHIVKNEPRNLHVGAAKSAVGHVVCFLFFYRI
jgi:hypothetical protein